MSELKFKGTPGPWRWEVNLSSKQINLCGGKPTYDLTVMDFDRWGMNGAQPRFNVDKGRNLQIMVKSQELTKIVEKREHHESWFRDVDHPDARLIAAAPELLDAIIKVHEFIEANENVNYKIRLLAREVPNIKELINKIL